MHPNKNVKIGGHNEKILETTPPPEEKIMQLSEKGKLPDERSLPH